MLQEYRLNELRAILAGPNYFLGDRDVVDKAYKVEYEWETRRKSKFGMDMR